MKNLTYLAIATAAVGMIACNGTPKGYVVTGTVEGAVDGDTVYLREASRARTILDTAIIDKGTFRFEGVQDSAVCRYVTCKVSEGMRMIDFFLENGNINLTLATENEASAGTPNNEAYQELRVKLNEIRAKLQTVYGAMSDSTLTDEQKAAKQAEGAELQEQYSNAFIECTKKNIANPVGVYLFKQAYYNFTTEENEALLQQIPANFQNDEVIVKIKEQIEKQKKTAEGQKFTDFEMKDPEGNPVKLSDYVGKGKVVLVDFWASWCGPCRQEMPNLVEAYAKYKDKNFEIVGVSLDRDAEAWKGAIKDLNITWPQMSDLKFWQCEGAQIYAVSGIPHVVLIDAEGTIIVRGLHGEELQNKLAEILK